MAQKIGKCFSILNKLNEFWFRSRCPQRFKLTVFDAVIRSKLVYGLDVVHLPKAVCNKLDSFQLKGLRKILRLDTTFINRANTNKRVFELANSIKNPEGRLNKDIRSFSSYVQSKQQAHVKHLVRAPNSDPIRQATLEPSTACPFIISNRRSGRPRGKCAEEVMRKLYLEHGYGDQAQFKENMAVACNAMREDIMSRSI